MDSSTSSSSIASPPTYFESYYGFIKDRQDVNILVEACIAGLVPLFTTVPSSTIRIRSGSVVVFRENALAQANSTRWRDGRHWSPSRVNGAFLLYREVEASLNKTATTTCTFKKVIPTAESDTHHNHFNTNDNNNNNTTNNNSNKRRPRVRFNTTSFRPYTQMVENGMVKRTLTVVGSDTLRYRVISYFYGADVAHCYGEGGGLVALKTPAQVLAFQEVVGRVPKLGKASSLSGSPETCFSTAATAAAAAMMLMTPPLPPISREASVVSVTTTNGGGAVGGEVSGLNCGRGCSCSCGGLPKGLKLFDSMSVAKWSQTPPVLAPLYL
ncbi:Gti1/Pac2 family-domain-containing protein [Obelidium mucronatum]|nr:Gti1/Pac2 family-domain-containing protein [Obelidium mucronatum]